MDYLLLGSMVIEIMKYLVVTYGLGFQLVRRKYLYFLSGIIMLCTMIGIYTEVLEFIIYEVIFYLIVVFLCFQGKLIKKFFSFIFEFFMIALVDNLIWIIIIAISNINYLDTTVYLMSGFVAEILGTVFWMVLLIALRNYRQKCQKFIESLSLVRSILVIAVVLGLSIILASSQAFLMNYSSAKMKEFALIASIAIALSVIVVFVININLNNSQKYLSELNIMNQQCILLQKQYYEELFKKNEDLRLFRHDYNEHMNMLKHLIENKEIERLKIYIDGMTQKKEGFKTISTGHIIADAIINTTMSDISGGNISFEFEGEFPKEMKISDIDLCTILSNGIINAKEEILRLKDGKGKISLHVSSYKNHLYLTIKNNADKTESDLLVSLKRDKKRHGLGTENMKEIVAKYNGKIDWKFDKGIFTVEIEIC